MKLVKDYVCIVLGSVAYALSTVLFIFPHRLLLGGTSGISVILELLLPFSPGTILMALNFSLIVLAFVILGKTMAVRTLVGSVLTTVAIGIFETIAVFENPPIADPYLSSTVGAAILALAGALMFYVDSGSGGTDIVALIVRKFSDMPIGRALLVTDVLIVLGGGMALGLPLLIASFIGLLIKTIGIDLCMILLQKTISKEGASSC